MNAHGDGLDAQTAAAARSGAAGKGRPRGACSVTVRVCWRRPAPGNRAGCRGSVRRHYQPFLNITNDCNRASQRRLQQWRRQYCGPTRRNSWEAHPPRFKGALSSPSLLFLASPAPECKHTTTECNSDDKNVGQQPEGIAPRSGLILEEGRGAWGSIPLRQQRLPFSPAHGSLRLTGGPG